jgi:endo-1,4-beta-xylanase
MDCSRSILEGEEIMRPLLLATSVLITLLCGTACSDGSSDAPPGSAGTSSAGNASSAGATNGGGSATAGSTSGGGSGGNSSVGTGGNGGSSVGGEAAGSAGAPTGGSGGNSSGGSGGAELAKFAGNITTSGQVRSDFAGFWDQITPENEGKWGSVESVRDQMNWGGLDAIHDYAQEHDIVFKQHTFVWGSQQPGWIGGLSPTEQREEVEEWIQLFCERYPDVAMIDVVNEPPPHTTPPYAEALGGAGSSGYDWIVQAFEWANQYCPNAILLLNDYNTIEYGGDNSHFLEIVNAIKDAGAPIDAIGVQAHAAYQIPTETVKGFIDNLAATGLPIYVTEYDINVADDNEQKTIMESQFTMFWEHPQIQGVTLWGYVVGATWLDNSGLMSSEGTMRPAMSWLMDYLGR